MHWIRLNENCGQKKNNEEVSFEICANGEEKDKEENCKKKLGDLENRRKHQPKKSDILGKKSNLEKK